MPIFFDLETGGLSAHKSSILSLSIAGQGPGVRTLVANPVPGSFMSSWAEGQVWEPVKNRASMSEGQLLEQFTNVLEKAPAGETLAGWNIGYEATPQDIHGRSKGFDIPFMLTRAEAYGLRDRMTSAIGKMKIRDIGQEYAAKLATEVLQYEDIVPADIFESARGYFKDTRFTAETPEQLARQAVALNRNISGWKQDLLHDTIFPEIAQSAHQSEYDVEAAMRLAAYEGPIFKGPEDVARYSRQALVNKLISSAKGGSTGEKTNTLEALLERARNPLTSTGKALPSVEKEFLEQLTERATTGKVPWERIVAGEGFGREAGTQWTEKIAGIQSVKLSKFASEAMDFAKHHKVAIGIGVGAAALYALQPGSWFSGKDDEYNTIEGLRHGGMAEKMRHQFTDFGSGWTARMGVAFKEAGKGLLDKKSWNRSFHEVFMTSEGRKELWNEAKWEIIGIGTTAALGLSKIAGKDDAYNTIEGLRHGGEAERKRHEMTDFGSGLIRMLFGRSKGFSTKEIKGLASSASNMSLDDFLKVLNVKKSANPLLKQGGGGINLASESAAKIMSGKGLMGSVAEVKKILHSEGLELGNAYVHPEAGQMLKDMYRTEHKGFMQGVRGELKNPEFRAALRQNKDHAKLLGKQIKEMRRGYKAMDKLSDDDVTKAIAFHEASELRNVNAIAGRRDTLKEMQSAFKRGESLQHTSVLPQEEYFLRHFKPEARDFFKGLRKIKDNNFSGFDDRYNTIEGLRHGGMTESLRKMLSDFGSGWIRRAISRGVSPIEIARALTREKHAGTGLTGLTARGPGIGTGITGMSATEFTEAAAAKQGDELVGFIREAYRVKGDKEMFRVTETYRAGGMGQTFKLEGYESGRAAIYKTAKESASGTLDSDRWIQGPALFRTRDLAEEIKSPDSPVVGYVQEYMNQIVSSTSSYGGKISPAYEAALQKVGRQQYGDIVPDVLGVTKKGFIQEFAGMPIPADSPATLKALPSMNRTWKQMVIGGGERVRHFDPQSENIVRQGTKLRVIDYGVSALGPRLSPQSEMAAESIIDDYTNLLHKKIMRKNKSVSNNIPELPAAGINPKTVPLGPIKTQPPVDTGTNVVPTKRLGGLPDGGLATEGNKVNTDFGSPVNLSKAVMRASETIPKRPTVWQRIGLARQKGLTDITKPNPEIAASRAGRQQSLHRRAQVELSKNTLRPGMRHRQKAGGIVK